MRDLSFFLRKNSLAAKMKKGILSFCNGVVSTSTLNQSKTDLDVSFMDAPSVVSSNMEEGNLPGSPLTLEDMILQLELEEEAARRAKLLDDNYNELQRRMSCVNNSDILRSARNALNQYPRFSLDGRDSMYRSSFCSTGAKTGGRRAGRSSMHRNGHCGADMKRDPALPPTLAGESVVWCKPGVVAKLMGLDAMPVPIGGRQGKRKLHSNKRQNLRMRRYELEKEKRLALLGMNGCKGLKRETVISHEPFKGRRDWRFA